MRFLLSKEMKKEVANDQKTVEQHPPKKLAQMTSDLQEMLKLFQRKLKNDKTTDLKSLQEELENWFVLYNSLEKEGQTKFKRWFISFDRQYQKIKGAVGKINF